MKTPAAGCRIPEKSGRGVNKYIIFTVKKPDNQ